MKKGKEDKFQSKRGNGGNYSGYTNNPSDCDKKASEMLKQKPKK
jgi:hypothetical protein